MSQLVALRCQNHGEREAVALCTRCRKPHCRECVTEHDGQVLCHACLAKPAEESRPKLGVLSRMVETGLLALSFVSLVLLFGLLGKLLMLIPREFHEGTVWHSEAKP